QFRSQAQRKHGPPSRADHSGGSDHYHAGAHAAVQLLQHLGGWLQAGPVLHQQRHPVDSARQPHQEQPDPAWLGLHRLGGDLRVPGRDAGVLLEPAVHQERGRRATVLRARPPACGLPDLPHDQQRLQHRLDICHGQGGVQQVQPHPADHHALPASHLPVGLPDLLLQPAVGPQDRAAAAGPTAALLAGHRPDAELLRFLRRLDLHRQLPQSGHRHRQHHRLHGGYQLPAGPMPVLRPPWRLHHRRLLLPGPLPALLHRALPHPHLGLSHLRCRQLCGRLRHLRSDGGADGCSDCRPHCEGGSGHCETEARPTAGQHLQQPHHGQQGGGHAKLRLC
ncbi:hypothetical protein BOX15_Mlig005382g1, partial [Macrostomum lignano]